MKKLITLALLVLTSVACTTSKKEAVKNHKYTNELINETSPYLLQHSFNTIF